jgi:antitoxin FitA
MSSLQVRELPENIYSLLKRRAEAEHRSIAQEAIALLAKGLDTSISPKARRAKLLQKIAEASGLSGGTVSKLDPVELIREDRER